MGRRGRYSGGDQRDRHSGGTARPSQRGDWADWGAVVGGGIGGYLGGAFGGGLDEWEEIKRRLAKELEGTGAGSGPSEQ